MSDGRKGETGVTCNQSYCLEHSTTLSRLAMLETALKGVQEDTKDFKDILKEVQKAITNGIMHRYPASIVWIISILTAFSSALLTVVLTRWGK